MNGLTGPLFNIGTLASRGLLNRGPTPGSPDEREDIFKRISDLLSNAPKRKDPSVIRRIGAALSGLQSGGRNIPVRYDPQRAQEVLDEPYNRELRDWQAEAAPLLQQYELETQRDATDLGKLKTISEIEGQGALREQRETAAQLSRARIAEIVENINSPDYTTPVHDGDRWFMIDKKSREIIEIDSNRMTDEERIKMEQAAIGDRQRGVEEVRQRGRLAVEDRRDARSGSEEDTLSPNEQRTAIANKAAEIRAQYPELNDYIQFLPNGTVTIVKPKNVGSRNGPTEEEATAAMGMARELIFGKKGKDINLKDENLGVISDSRIPDPSGRPPIQPPPGQTPEYQTDKPKELIEAVITELIGNGMDRAAAIAELKKERYNKVMPQQRWFDTNLESIMSRLNPTATPPPNPISQIGSRSLLQRPPQLENRVELDDTPLTETDPILAMIRDAVGGYMGLNEGLLGESDAGAIGDALGLIGPGSGMKLGAVAFPALARVFHGTINKFHKLDPSRGNTRDLLGDLLHFAQDPEYAASYAGKFDLSRNNFDPNIRVSELDSPRTLDITQQLPEEDVSALLDAGLSSKEVNKFLREMKTNLPTAGHMFHDLRSGRGRGRGEILEGSPFTGIRYFDSDIERGPVWGIPNPQQETLSEVIDLPRGPFYSENQREIKSILERLKEQQIDESMIQSNPSWTDIFKDESGSLNVDKLKELWRTLNSGPPDIPTRSPIGRADDLIGFLGGDINPPNRGISSMSDMDIDELIRQMTRGKFGGQR